MRSLLALTLLPLFAFPAFAQKDSAFDKAVKKVEVRFEPAEAKPGQTVTLKITLTLADGYYTYPTFQPDKQAAGMVNKLQVPAPGSVIFVGEPFDPKGYKSKSEPLIGIEDLRYYVGTVTFEHPAVVSPKAAPGAVEVKIPGFLVSVCDKDNCFPPKKLTPQVTLKVLDGPAVPVQKAYQDEVTKALNGK
jgi:hypothetical protein